MELKASEVDAEPDSRPDDEPVTASESEGETETDKFAPRNDPSRLSVNEKVVLENSVIFHEYLRNSSPFCCYLGSTTYDHSVTWSKVADPRYSS